MVADYRGLHPAAGTLRAVTLRKKALDRSRVSNIIAGFLTDHRAGGARNICSVPAPRAFAAQNTTGLRSGVLHSQRGHGNPARAPAREKDFPK
jgi:hypothetical protein